MKTAQSLSTFYFLVVVDSVNEYFAYLQYFYSLHFIICFDQNIT